MSMQPIYATPPKLATRFNPYDRSKSRYLDGRERPLDTDQMRRYIPSIFAEAAHETRSARYAYIPTSDVLDGLAREGFKPFYAIEARSRKDDRLGFTKHMVRLRHADSIAKQGKEVSEIILINSHDGSSAYQMLSGCFRFVCANGLICGDTFSDKRVRHSGNARAEVVAHAIDMLDRFEVVDASKDRMKSLQLTSGEQKAFAHAALAARYDGADHIPLEPEQALQARRWDDRGDSLWATFNRVQENLVQGGLQGRAANGRRVGVRQVQGIDGNVALNRALWTLAEKMAELKAA